MKNLLLACALLVSSIVFSQKADPVLDSIQVYTPMEIVLRGGGDSVAKKPELIITLYKYKGFYDKLTELSDKSGDTKYIVKFYYKEKNSSEQKVYTTILQRNK